MPFGERVLSQLFKHREGGECTEFENLKNNPHFKEIVKEITSGQGEWQRIRTISHAYNNRGDLTQFGKVWFYFVNFVLNNSKHVSIVRKDRAILLYALVKGYEINVVRIVEISIMDYAKGNFAGNIPHPYLITHKSVIQEGVKFNEEEDERCPKTSPLTLVGVLKALVESEEGERREKPTKKRKRVDIEE